MTPDEQADEIRSIRGNLGTIPTAMERLMGSLEHISHRLDEVAVAVEVIEQKLDDLITAPGAQRDGVD